MEKEYKNIKLAIVLFTNKNYLFACGAFILNIIEKLSNYSDIIVYHSDLDDEDIAKLTLLDQNIKFIKYTFADFIEEFFINEDKNKIQDLIFIKLFTHLAAVKFKIFKLLNEYDQVVFFDIDMLLKSNLDILLSNVNYNVIWRSDGVTINNKLSMFYPDTSGFRDFVPYYDKFGDIDTPNGGFIVLNKNFDYESAFNLARDFFIKALKFDLVFIDEFVFGVVAYIMELSVYKVDPNLYNVPPFRYNVNSILIHFMRQFKPWEYEEIQFTFPEWIERYRRFENITGLSSHRVKYFKNIAIPLFRNMRYTFYSDVLKRIKTPTDLSIPYELKERIIEFTFNAYLSYKIEKIAMTDVMQLSLSFSERILSEMGYSIEDVRLSYPEYRITYDRKRDKLIFDYGRATLDNIHTKFQEFYNATFNLRASFALPKSQFPIKKITLMTFHKKYLTINNLQLFQTTDPLMSNNITIFLTKDHKILMLTPTGEFIYSVSNFGFFKTQSAPFIFDCKHKQGKTSILINGMYLSARTQPPGSFSLTPHCKEWEIFDVIDTI